MFNIFSKLTVKFVPDSNGSYFELKIKVSLLLDQLLLDLKITFKMFELKYLNNCIVDLIFI